MRGKLEEALPCVKSFRSKSAGPSLEQHHLHGLGPVLEVVDDAHFPYGRQTVLELLDGVLGAFGVLELHLREPGDAGFDEESLAAIRDVPLELDDKERALRARPDEAHVAHEDVDELRQLIESRLSNESSNRVARPSWFVASFGPSAAASMGIEREA